MAESQIESQLKDLQLRCDEQDVKKLNADMEYLKEKNLNKSSPNETSNSLSKSNLTNSENQVKKL